MNKSKKTSKKKISMKECNKVVDKMMRGIKDKSIHKQLMELLKEVGSYKINHE